MSHRFLGFFLAVSIAFAIAVSGGVRVETRADWLTGEGYVWWQGC